MAEYINREQLDRKFIVKMLSPTTTTIFDAKDIIDELQPADVIERAEYDKLLKENEELKETCQNCIDADSQNCEAFAELQSKIDNAIEEMKQDVIAHSGTGEEVIQAYCDGLKKALEYLENIGE